MFFASNNHNHLPEHDAAQRTRPLGPGEHSLERKTERTAEIKCDQTLIIPSLGKSIDAATADPQGLTQRLHPQPLVSIGQNQDRLNAIRQMGKKYLKNPGNCRRIDPSCPLINPGEMLENAAIIEDIHTTKICPERRTSL